MPVGSECHTSGLRSWVSRGKRMVVKIVVVSVGAELDGEEEEEEGLSAEERRTRWRELRAWERIWRHGLRE